MARHLREFVTSGEEGQVAKTIEKRTSRIPSDAFLWGAAGAAGSSLILQAMGKRGIGTFVGQMAPTLLILGLYNKVVKLLGSERSTAAGML